MRSFALTRLHWVCIVVLVSANLTTYRYGFAQSPIVPLAATTDAQLPAEVQAKLDKLQADLKAAQVANDQASEANTLNSIGAVYSDLGEQQKSLDYFNQALPRFRAVGDRDGEGRALLNIGEAYSDLGQKQKALDFFSQALPCFRQVKNTDAEADTLNNLGLNYSNLGQKKESLGFFNEALPLFRQAIDPSGEAYALLNKGSAESGLGEKQIAVDLFNQALPLFQQQKDTDGEANTWIALGSAQSDQGIKPKAVESLTRALALFLQANDVDGKANALLELGSIESDLGEKQKTLSFLQEALPLLKQVNDSDGEGNALLGIGSVYSDLGDYNQALISYNQALPFFDQASDGDGKANTITNIGEAYLALGQKQKALNEFSQTLPLFRKVKDPGGEAWAHLDIGLVYFTLNSPAKAMNDLKQATPLFRQVGDREGEAEALNNIGDAYVQLKKPQEALAAHLNALPISVELNNPILEAWICYNLMQDERTGHPALAIFHGKQAVNLLQQVRGNIQGLDKKLQSSFLTSKENYYRDLADLLIDQGRLPEAEQVLDLLKQQEYLDYTRGVDGSTLTQLPLTPAEQKASIDYDHASAQLVVLGQQLSQLEKLGSRSPAQEKQFQQLNQQLVQAGKGLNDTIARLYILFGKDQNADHQQQLDAQGDAPELNRLLSSLPNTVALYTLVTPTRYRIIVVTGAKTVPPREYVIAEKELNRKIAQFKQVLSTPDNDPKPLATELYNILIGPVKKDLDEAHAKTLVWYFYGVLRYVPLAALYDPVAQQYLVQNYNNVTVTHQSLDYLAQKPDVGRLSAVAMGLARKYEENLPKLSSVVDELNGIVKDPRVSDSDGRIPGTILLDGQFTEKAMDGQLSSGPEVVHIASHFVFQSGDYNQSYLLLAGKDTDTGGYHMTVADFTNDPSLTLAHTDLLTLSACETGVTGNASNGYEVEGLSAVAQHKGAKAVISTLWEVNDSSTGDLMADFYKRWSAGEGDVSKIEALRQAQLDLLTGKVAPKPDYTGDPNAPTSYVHPYYWAPFVLMGNWR